MAAYAASLSSWIPEDDILLKNAVEAGASLEALAKGAVRFSRKFSIAELQHRWHSLLYDPVIAAEAAAHMAEFELSAANNEAKSIRSAACGDHSEAPQKRKAESVRRLYYALRKRTCTQSLNSCNLCFLASPNMSDGVGDGAAFQEHGSIHYETPVESSMLGDCVQNCFELQEMDIDYLHHGPQDNNFIKESLAHHSYEQENVHEDSAHVLGETSVGFENCPVVKGVEPSDALLEKDAPFHVLGYSSSQSRTPLWKTMEFNPTPEMPINMSHGDESQSSIEKYILADDMNEKRMVLPTNPEFDLGYLSDTLLNFGNEEELHFIDADNKKSIDKSFHDNINPTVLSSTNDIHEDNIPDVKEPHTCPVMLDGSNHAELEVIGEKSSISHDNQHNIFCSEVNVPSSTLIPNPPSHDLLDGEMFCTLNTEDKEIPGNDDFIPSKVVASLAPQTSYKGASALASSFDAQKDSEQKLGSTKKDNCSTQYFTASHTRVSDMFPGSNHNPRLCGTRDKSKSIDVNSRNSISRQVNTAHGDVSQYRSDFPAQTSLTHAKLKEKSLQTSSATDVLLHTKSSSTRNNIPEPEVNPSTLDPEAILHEEEYESDDHIPDFSDIESMILDLDLCPEELDTCFNTKVSRYQHDDTKKTIIRLEQCAQSCIQRAIGYQGALALLYGRHTKHYIKESEVILGRATDDVDVDIDLGREGRANKISRRQALIKLEEGGSFILRNLGRSSIFLNGKEITTGQGFSLSPNTLIQIRDLSFMFEIHQVNVRRYLANVTRTNLEKKAKFEWSNDGVP
ncbi:uncharacterized protein LOC123199091 [Mangifera indica]|uniref:uncharacterized protein LOC123199091 n=1 Tax=Mangifera indica TaxID=29780 RepID=UPI001CF9A46F|nr:uncharacterized protein LOC123199091 [Mangifera indica]XP_044469862.1 uncharacterized protein LOC123199091 [Mangifera indica]